MEPRKDVFDLLRDWVKSERPILILIGAAGFVALVSLPHFLIKTTEGWNELNAISTFAYMLIALCTFPVIAMAAYSAFRQLSEMSSTRMLAVLPYLIQEILKNKEAAETRRKIFNKYCEDPRVFHSISSLSRNGLSPDCQKIFYDYSEVGIFMQRGLLEEFFVKDMLHINLAKMWIILKHYAEDEAQRRGYKNYTVPFQRISELGFSYLEELGMKELIIYHSDDEKLNKVITESQLKIEFDRIRNSLANAQVESQCSLPCCTLNITKHLS